MRFSKRKSNSWESWVVPSWTTRDKQSVKQHMPRLECLIKCTKYYVFCTKCVLQWEGWPSDGLNSNQGTWNRLLKRESSHSKKRITKDCSCNKSCWKSSYNITSLPVGQSKIHMRHWDQPTNNWCQACYDVHVGPHGGFSPWYISHIVLEHPHFPQEG